MYNTEVYLPTRILSMKIKLNNILNRDRIRLKKKNSNKNKEIYGEHNIRLFRTRRVQESMGLNPSPFPQNIYFLNM